MCLSMPGKIVSIKGKMAKVVQEDHEHLVDISTLTEVVGVGDFLTFYQNVAVNKIAKQQAEEILALVKQQSRKEQRHERT